jgi:hypothetical protein
MTMLEKMQPALRSLLRLENELRSAARNALIMRSDEAKTHMEAARRHYQEAVQAIKKELGQSSEAHATTDTEPDRAHLGPTGPATVKKDRQQSHEETHPHAGNVPDTAPGPMPTDDPNKVASNLEHTIDKKRVPPA